MEDPTKTILVVSAHAADFVWRAGGAIALYASRGYKVRILCLSYGERGESQGAWKQPGMTLERVKEIRRAESTRAAEILGAEVRFFDAGDVLVVATTSESDDGMFGELLGESCRAHGVVGLAIDAGVRDTSELTAMNFPVWAKAISAQGTVKATAGCVNVEVVCAGALVRPGDVIVGDGDGVVVVPRLAAVEVARLGAERRAREERSRARLKSGELGLDIYGLRGKLAELGVQWVESEESLG